MRNYSLALIEQEHTFLAFNNKFGRGGYMISERGGGPGNW